jgi:hypothetical protein
MSRQKIPWLPVGAVAILGVAIVVMKSVHPAAKDDPEEIPSVQAASFSGIHAGQAVIVAVGAIQDGDGCEPCLRGDPIYANGNSGFV